MLGYAFFVMTGFCFGLVRGVKIAILRKTIIVIPLLASIR
jgi:hypothetical protein